MIIVENSKTKIFFFLLKRCSLTTLNYVNNFFFMHFNIFLRWRYSVFCVNDVDRPVYKFSVIRNDFYFSRDFSFQKKPSSYTTAISVNYCTLKPITNVWHRKNRISVETCTCSEFAVVVVYNHFPFSYYFFFQYRFFFRFLSHHPAHCGLQTLYHSAPVPQMTFTENYSAGRRTTFNTCNACIILMTNSIFHILLYIGNAYQNQPRRLGGWGGGGNGNVREI